MNPNEPNDSFTEWLKDNWQPAPTNDVDFATRLTKRGHAQRQKRRIATAVGASITLLVIGLGIWNLSPGPEAGTTVPLDIPEVAQNDEASTQTDFWASAFDEVDDTQAIPDDYEALAGFFFGDT